MKHSDSHHEESLPGAAEVKRAYRALPQTDVPAELDAAVLARARDAANKTHVASKRIALRRWAIPLSAAASILVAMSVVYEMRFNAPPQVATVKAVMLDQEKTSASPAESAQPEMDLQKPAAPRAKHRSDTAKAPPPVVVGLTSPQVVPSLPAAISIAPTAPVIAVPLPPASSTIAANAAGSAAASELEEGVAANESRLEKKQPALNSAEDKTISNITAPASADAAAGQVVQSMSARRANKLDMAEPKPSLASLSTLAGHYQYVSYKVVNLSGEVTTLKDQGYATASLHLDAQGTLTQTLAAADGKVVTRTAKVLQLKFDGHSGYWVVLWSDMTYPVESSIALTADKLVSRTQFEELADEARFGNVELATLKRTGL